MSGAPSPFNSFRIKYDYCRIYGTLNFFFYYCTLVSYFGHFEMTCPTRNSPSFTMSSSIWKSQVIKQQENNVKTIIAACHYMGGRGEVARYHLFLEGKNGIPHQGKPSK